MLTKEIQPNAECREELHLEHLCYITSQGFHLSDEHEYKTLVNEPRFLCCRCGRIANSSRNLCVPTEL